jgi:hypothetical protein
VAARPSSTCCALGGATTSGRASKEEASRRAVRRDRDSVLFLLRRLHCGPAHPSGPEGGRGQRAPIGPPLPCKLPFPRAPFSCSKTHTTKQALRDIHAAAAPAAAAAAVAAASAAAALACVVDIERQLWRAMHAKGHVELAAKFEAHMAAPERAAMPLGERRDYLARLLGAAGHGALAEALRHYARDAPVAPAATAAAAPAAAAKTSELRPPPLPGAAPCGGAARPDGCNGDGDGGGGAGEGAVLVPPGVAGAPAAAAAAAASRQGPVGVIKGAWMPEEDDALLRSGARTLLGRWTAALDAGRRVESLRPPSGFALTPSAPPPFPLGTAGRKAAGTPRVPL